MPMHERYAVAHDFLSPEGRARDPDDLADGQRVLPLGVQLLRDARQGRHGLPDRLRERVPGRRGDLAALLLPVGDEGAAALVDVLRGHGAGGEERRWTPGRGSRSPTTRTLDYAGQARGLPARSPIDHFETERYAEFCDSTLPTRRRHGAMSMIDVARLPLVAAVDDPADVSRRTSGSGSRATSGGCSGCGRPTTLTSRADFLLPYAAWPATWKQVTSHAAYAQAPPRPAEPRALRRCRDDRSGSSAIYCRD
jgi:hypothetical protein